MKHTLTAFAVALGLAACTETGGVVSQGDTAAPTTATALLAAGGQQLDAAKFRSDLVDVTLAVQDNSWTWNINADGSTTSAAADESWTDSGNWRILNDQYCRTSPSFDVGEERCSSVYELGGRYYFSVSGSDTDLNTWNVAPA